MALVINNQTNALFGKKAAKRADQLLNKTLQKLATGQRINSASDDAAGLAIANRMAAEIRGLQVAGRNASDAIGVAQTAGGALGQATNSLQRMRELAIQAGNGALNPSDRSALQSEFNQLQSQLGDIAGDTTFGGQNLLDGSYSGTFQVGSGPGDAVDLSLSSASPDALGVYNSQGPGTSSQASLGTDNGVVADPDGLAITGPNGSASTAAIAANASAGSIADAVNAVSGETGVTADARTTATLSNLSDGGQISFDLTGSGNRVNISATVSDPGDVSGLAEAINAQTSQTGISATAEGGTLSLTSEDGDDIQIENFSGGAAGNQSVDFQGSTGSSVTLTEGGSDAGVVGGELTLSSNGSFSIDSVDPSILAGSSTTLSNVSSASIASPEAAQSAVQAIDGALSRLSDQQAMLGAFENRLTSSIANLEQARENLSDARSRIFDTDYAKQSSELIRAQLMKQSAIGMLGQANIEPAAAFRALGIGAGSN